MLQILLVDDEPYVVEDLMITIPWQSLGIEHVHIAFSAAEALSLVKQHPIDIVLTDINMPEINGLELISLIKKNWKHIKCILLTGYAEFEYAKQAIAQNVSDYLLKPITDEDIINALKKVKRDIQAEWENIAHQQKTIQTLNEHLPMLRDKFLNDILQGRIYNGELLAKKALQLHIPFEHGHTVAFLLIRLEDYYQKHDLNSQLLFEYAIINVTVEMLETHFDVWNCKDVHDYLVFLIKPKDQASFHYDHHIMENTAYQIQKNVSTIIGGEISVVTTSWGKFFQDTRQLYQTALSTIHQRVGSETGVFISAAMEIENQNVIPSIQSLYDPPSLFHLFETNNWEAIKHKIELVCHDLTTKNRYTQEHIVEVKNLIEAAILYYVHRNNKLLHEVIDISIFKSRSIGQVEQLKEWALLILSKIKLYFDTDKLDKRSVIITKIQDYIKSNLNYVSLHTIADFVKLHPVYLSKIFKAETGQKLSDYIFQAKMEVASHLLLTSELKVYQISEQLGYSNAHYFIKVFKDYSGATPQEFRDHQQLR